MYEWRKMTSEQRAEVLERRQGRRRPWHRPPHEGGEEASYHLTATCYEHRPFIGHSPARMEAFEAELLEIAQQHSIAIYAWAVLPNHYHMLLRSEDIEPLLDEIGQMHGRTSYNWNGEENSRGRQVWHACVDRRIRSERHYWATMNYVHHNPVKHGYVKKWEEWPYSSAAVFIQNMGKKETERIWRQYPLLDYGKGWDDPEM